MLERDLSIPEVARRVGYRDLRTFERAFKRWTRLTPSQFKRSCAPR